MLNQDGRGIKMGLFVALNELSALYLWHWGRETRDGYTSSKLAARIMGTKVICMPMLTALWW